MTLDIEVQKVSSGKDSTRPDVGDRIWRSIGPDGEYRNSVEEIFKVTEDKDLMFRCWYNDQSETDKPVFSSNVGPNGYYQSKRHSDKGLVCIIKGQQKVDDDFAFAEVSRISQNGSTAFVELFNAPVEVVEERISGHMYDKSDRVGYQKLDSYESMDRDPELGDLKLMSENSMYRFWLHSTKGGHPRVTVERDLRQDRNWEIIDVYDPLSDSDEIKRQVKKNMDK
jgi:hypothetical protein